MPAEAFDRADAQDELELDPETTDPNRVYRWVHRRKLAKRRKEGYTVELRSSSGIRLMSDDPSLPAQAQGHADDQFRVGDLFLMSCPKPRFAARRKQVAQLAEARLGIGTQRFRQKGRKLGVKTLEGEEGEKR